MKLDIKQGRCFFSDRSLRLSTYPEIGCAVFWPSAWDIDHCSRHYDQAASRQHMRDFLSCLVFEIDDPLEELRQHHTPYLSFVLLHLGDSHSASTIQKFDTITILFFSSPRRSRGWRGQGTATGPPRPGVVGRTVWSGEKIEPGAPNHCGFGQVGWDKSVY